MTLAARAGAKLIAAQRMVATAESCTAGLVAVALTETAGSSAWFECGLVTYSNDSKTRLLGVPEQTLLRFGAVSEETARAMAEGMLARCKADVALSVTGIAGPNGAVPGKPVGTVCFGWAERSGARLSETRHFAGDRAAVRRAACQHALERIIERLETTASSPSS